MASSPENSASVDSPSPPASLSPPSVSSSPPPPISSSPPSSPPPSLGTSSSSSVLLSSPPPPLSPPPSAFPPPPMQSSSPPPPTTSSSAPSLPPPSLPPPPPASLSSSSSTSTTNPGESSPPSPLPISTNFSSSTNITLGAPPPKLSFSSPPPPMTDLMPSPNRSSSLTTAPPPPVTSSSSSSSYVGQSPPQPSTSTNQSSTDVAVPSRSSSRSSSHSPSSSKSHTPSPTHHSTSDVNIPLVIGVTAGLGLFFVLMIVMAFCCSRKKKKHQDNMAYFTDPSYNTKGKQYYNPSQNPGWQNGAPTDHFLKVPPPPGGMQPRGSWQPPPPMPLSSTSGASSNFSGPHGPPLPPPSPNIALGFNKSTFSYEELAAATDGFSQANLLGQGGFGYVYKGYLLNGKEIAVKQLKSGSGQGEREFQAEVEIISRVHHRHLASLVGYCISEGQRMLVYEFVPNKTLEFHLHGKDRPTMSFPTRLKIALGSAKGLAYLHEDCHPRIIHRDIKTANILLDHNFEAQVADFGLAKLSSDNYTHVSTRVMGTFGYLAPEYASSGKLTEKSDVFSFGVMLLELITGRRPVDTTATFLEDSLVDWARPLLSDVLSGGSFDQLIDPRLEKNYNPEEMMRMVACAAASVRHSAKRRPKMSQIVRALEGDSSLDDLNEGMKPGQSSLFSGSNGSSDYDSHMYNADMRRMRRMALGQGMGSSDYSGPTSEYGLHPSSSSSEMGNSREINQQNI